AVGLGEGGGADRGALGGARMGGGGPGAGRGRGAGRARRAAVGRQRNVGGAREPPLPGILRGAMAYSEEPHPFQNPTILAHVRGGRAESAAQDFSTKIFCAARTLAPKSTGWPSSASTCSSAANAMRTSVSPA